MKITSILIYNYESLHITKFKQIKYKIVNNTEYGQFHANEYHRNNNKKEKKTTSIELDQLDFSMSSNGLIKWRFDIIIVVIF